MDQQTEATNDAAWGRIFEGPNKERIEALLPEYLRGRRWFSAKARTIRQVRLAGAVPFAGDPAAAPLAYITFLEVEYAEGDRQTFVLPLAHADGTQAAQVLEAAPAPLVTHLDADAGGGILYDALWSASFPVALLDAVGEDRRLGDATTGIHAWPTAVFAQITGAARGALTPRVVGAEQSNTSIIYGEALILKLFRRLEGGLSPDLEIGRFLTAQGFAHIPPLAGALELTTAEQEPRTLAIMQGFVPNRGDAWSYTLGELAAYFVRAAEEARPPLLPQSGHLLDVAREPVPPQMRAVLGPYLDSARLLGRRTAELHLALASDPADPGFAPEPLGQDYQRALYAGVQQLAQTAFGQLAARLDKLPEATRVEATTLLGLRGAVLAAPQPLLDREIAAQRTRVHGDYHLGQVLYTGADFVIIDFEGEPLRSLAERRRKQGPLKDVAGMLRSFHYAAYAALFSRTAYPGAREASTPVEAWTEAWHRWVGAAFLAEYLQVAAAGAFLPPARDDLQVLLDAYLLEKAVYELIYELNNRPDWVRIPLAGIRQLAG